MIRDGNSVVAIVVALISAGLMAYLRDGVRWVLRSTRSQSPIAVLEREVETHLGFADRTVLTARRVLDELQEENARLRATDVERAQRLAEERAQLAEERAQHGRDRADWNRERTALRREIDHLEMRIRALLDEVVQLRTRHDPGRGHAG